MKTGSSKKPGAQGREPRSLQRLVMPLAFKRQEHGTWRLAMQSEPDAVRGMFVAEKEYRRLKRIEKAARRDYRENIHLADGPVCTLRGLWSVFGKAKAKRHNRGFSNADGYQPQQPESRSDG